MQGDDTTIKDEVREVYARAALGVSEHGCGCGDGGECCGTTSSCAAAGDEKGIGGQLYEAADRASLPDQAVLASLGCGNPTAVAELREGETVLDLGSGGGIDVLLSAQRVGTTGKAFGLDMTDEMLDLARRNAEQAGATNVEFLRGDIEAVPLPGRSVDVIISNCVINLATDKSAVFGEMRRVLKPGGRIGITDIVAADELTPAERADRGSYAAGCIAGALSFAEFRSGLEAAGFVNVELTPTHDVADGVVSAIVRATAPVEAEAAAG